MSSNKKNKSSLPTNSLVDKFDMLSPMLNSALEEVREFSKKKQDGVLNPLKVKIINRLLNDIKGILVNEASVDYLEVLDEDTLPQNSDVVLVLGQYKAAMKLFHSKFYGRDSFNGEYRWFTQENPDKVNRN